MLFSNFRVSSLILIVLISISSISSADPDSCLSTTWPHEQSTLEPDPSIYFGRLENGLRFVLQSNTEPRDRVAVYLNVEAGSLHEKQDEQGLAHYLEHIFITI